MDGALCSVTVGFTVVESHWNNAVPFRQVGALPGGKGGRWVGLTTLPPSCAVVR